MKIVTAGYLCMYAEKCNFAVTNAKMKPSDFCRLVGVYTPP